MSFAPVPDLKSRLNQSLLQTTLQNEWRSLSEEFTPEELMILPMNYARTVQDFKNSSLHNPALIIINEPDELKLLKTHHKNGLSKWYEDLKKCAKQNDFDDLL